jgi:ABC-type Zn uptake system ZnuABC Zn-binding protein ZnuA
MMYKVRWCLAVLFFSTLVLTACSQKSGQSSVGDKLMVVATTTIIGDVVSHVAGDLIDLNVMLPLGTDPHGFDPTPQDVAKVADADVLFANGAGLEEFLDVLIESAGAEDKVKFISDGIDFLASEDEHDNEGVDPHTWTDPNNVMVWVKNIEHKLSEMDPTNAVPYAANTASYLAELEELDAWIREQVALIPEADKKIVTDHNLFGYFVEEYGFEQVGTLIPGYSALAEPSAQELAKVEDLISDFNVKAIFVGKSVNPGLAQRVTEDTGTKLVFIYTGSLSELDGEAGTYVEYMRYNTIKFVEALK